MFTIKKKRDSIPMWAFPLVACMAMLVILLASQPGAVLAQGGASNLGPYVSYATDATNIYVVPRIANSLPDLNSSSRKLVTATPNCDVSPSTTPGILTLSDGNGDFFAIWHDTNNNNSCYARFVRDTVGNFTQQDIGTWNIDENLIDVADLNKDGRDDVLFQGKEPGMTEMNYKVALAQADGSLDMNAASITLVPSAWIGFIGMSDITGDGNEDLLFHSAAHGGNFTTEIYMLRGHGDGRFDDVANKQLVVTGPDSTGTTSLSALADFNNDARQDIFLGVDDDATDEGQNYIALNQGNNSFSVQPSFDSRPENEGWTSDNFWVFASACDYNLDNNVDLFVSNRYIPSNSGVYTMHLGDGTGEFAEGTVFERSLACSRHHAMVEPPPMCGCEIDLVNNTHNCQDVDPISFVYGPATNQAVVKVGFDPTLYNHSAVRFDVEYGGQPNGWTVNIGDSQSNNGYTGDGGNQSHDAEMQILNSDMTVFASDMGGSGPLFSQGGLVTGGTTVSLEVRDGHLSWDNHSGIASQLNSPYLYALNGQADNQGPVNYDIYAGFNRTIGSSGRNGSGATKVTISCLQETEPVVTCDGAQGYPGDTLLVDLIATGTNVYGLQVNSAVDPNVVTPNSATFGSFFTNPYLVAANNINAAAGTWLGAVSQQNPNPPVTGSGTFATVSYQAVNPGSSNVTLSPLFSDRDGFEIPSTVSSCVLTVLPFGSITGIVTYQGRLAHANIKVVAGTNNDLTDNSGNFEIGGLTGGNYNVRADVASYLPACRANVPVSGGLPTNLPDTRLLGGDVNDDIYTNLIINIGDFTRLTASFGLNASADVQADINADSTINVQDLSILGGNYGVSGCQTW